MWSRLARAFLFCGALAATASAALADSADSGFSLNGGVPNLQPLKQQIISYYESGRQSADVARVDDRAREYVAGRLAAGAKRPAVVFDIDDTSLSTYPYEKSLNFGFDQTSWTQWERRDAFPIIAPTLAFTKYLRAHGVALFFVTGRREPDRATTIRELAKAGYPTPTGVYFRPVTDRDRSVISYKSGMRAKIEAQGYDILASVGDQWSDLRGGHAERIYKLPNPMYFLP